MIRLAQGHEVGIVRVVVLYQHTLVLQTDHGDMVLVVFQE
jgi:hypothetical protein